MKEKSRGLVEGTQWWMARKSEIKQLVNYVKNELRSETSVEEWNGRIQVLFKYLFLLPM
jgi:hypothetical protein